MILTTSQSSPLVLDTYAWVEYALGTEKAEVVSKYLEGDEEVLTPATVLAELKELMLRRGVKRSDRERVIAYVRSRTVVVAVDSELAELAGEVNFRNKKNIEGWGMLDSFVQAVAIVKKGKVLTGDPHFRGLGNVVYIGD